MLSVFFYCGMKFIGLVLMNFGFLEVIKFNMGSTGIHFIKLIFSNLISSLFEVFLYLHAWVPLWLILIDCI